MLSSDNPVIRKFLFRYRNLLKQMEEIEDRLDFYYELKEINDTTDLDFYANKLEKRLSKIKEQMSDIETSLKVHLRREEVIKLLKNP